MKFSRAILVNPPHPPGYVSNKDSHGGFGDLFPRGAPPFPPLDLPYLAAYLLREGFEVEVIEAGALDLSCVQTCEAIDAKGGGDPDRTLAVIRTSLPTIDWDLDVCAEIRRRSPGLRIARCGSAVPSLLFRIQRDPSIDFAVLGEPDETVTELMHGEALPQIAGLLFREGDGWRRTPERKAERDLDRLPFPRWELLPYERYVIPKSSVMGRMRFLPILTSRGCPFGCNYCPYPTGQGLKWRYRSPGNVVDEIEHLVHDLGVEYVLFRDPMFSLNQKRVVAICEEILRRGLRVKWACETRVDCLEEPTIATMARAGCTGINFGVESSDPEIQKGVHRKPILAPEFVEKVAICRRYQIRTFAFFIIGLPGDTVDTILSSVRFAVEIGASWTQFTIATPFVGTKLHQWAVDRGLIADDHYRMISSHEGSIGNEHLSPAQIQRLHRFAQFAQRNLINRRGILKNEGRTDPAYRTVKSVADVAGRLAAGAWLWTGDRYFRRDSWRRSPSPLTSKSALRTGRAA
jgi:anaerobic magnesium-protoporphyrin IX monomethyl ester cyclase